MKYNSTCVYKRQRKPKVQSGMDNQRYSKH